MEPITNKINQIINRINPKKNWGWVLAIGIFAVGLIVTTVYYGGYLRNIFTGVRAAASKTWLMSDSNDFYSSSGVTFGSGYATVDLAFNPISVDPKITTLPNVTDLWYNGSNIMGAAIDVDDAVGYSVDDGPWSVFSIQYADQNGTDNGIKIKKIVDAGAYNYVFGLGSTRATGSHPGNAAVIYGTMTLSELNALNYLYLPTASSFNAGITFKGRLYAGMTPKNPTTDSDIVSVNQTLGDAQFITLGSGYVTSVNNFLVSDGRLYATVTGKLNASGPAVVWYTDDGTTWQEGTIGTFPPTTDHSLTNSITADTEGYIYVTTDANYILKSTVPNGSVFEKIFLPSGSVISGVIYADSSNNLWMPLMNGSILRSIDYVAGEGANEFFRMNTAISFGGGDQLRVNDVLKISNGKTFWAGGVWQGSSFAHGAAFSSHTATGQYFVNKVGLKFFDLQTFSAATPPIVNNGQFKYRLSNMSETGPWYYFDISGSYDWEPATNPNLSEANTALELYNPAQPPGTRPIETFTTKYGQGNGLLYVQVVHYQPDTDLENYDVILKSITVGYIEPEAHFQVDVAKYLQVNTDFSFTVTALDPDGEVMTSFKPNGVDNDPSWVLRSNLMSVPPVIPPIPPDDGKLINCTPGNWVNGVLTYTGCQVTAADDTQNRWIGVGYYDNELQKIIYNYSTTLVVDPIAEPLDHFVVLIMPLTVSINTPFTIRAEARISPDLGNFIKTNFNDIVTVIADGPDSGEEDDGFITPVPTTIGDPGVTGTWTNGTVVAFNIYRISVPNPYTIILDYQGITGKASMRVDDPSIPSLTSLNPNSGTVNTPVEVIGLNFGDEPGQVLFSNMDGTNATSAQLDPNFLDPWKSNSIRVNAPLPPGGSTGQKLVRVVRSDNKQTTQNVTFTYAGVGSPPVIDYLNPNFGDPGDPVDVHGSAFGDTTGQVLFGLIPAQINSWADGLINITVPAGAPDSDVDVTVVREADSAQSNSVDFHYNAAAAVPMAARYYSPVFPITEMVSLNDAAIVAYGYSFHPSTQYASLRVGLGLFQDSALTQPLGPGDFVDQDAGSGYYLLTNDPDGAKATLTTLSQMTDFNKMRYVRFIVSMSTPDKSMAVTDQPWLESITLNVTLAQGSIGKAFYKYGNPDTLPLVNTTDPVTFTMEVDSSISSHPEQWVFDIQMGLKWTDSSGLSDGPAPANVHYTATIDNGQPTDTDTMPLLPNFGPDAYVLKITFQAFNGAVFDDTQYHFVVNGQAVGNSNVIFDPSAPGTLILQNPPSFTVSVVPADQKKVVAQGDAVNFNIEVTGKNGFSGDVSFTTDVIAQFDSGRITDPVDFNPGSVTVTGANPVPAVLTLQTNTLAGSHSDLEKWIAFTIKGTSGTLESSASAQLYILRLPVPDGEFVLITTDPADKVAAPSNDVTYGIEVVYSPTFNTSNDITLSIPDLATQFTDVTGQFNPPTLTSGATGAQLTLTIGANPNPLADKTNFVIRGTSGAIVVDATPVPSLTITRINTIINITANLQEIPIKAPEDCDTNPANICDNWYKTFVLNLYPANATNPVSDLVIALPDLVAQYDPAQFSDPTRSQTTITLTAGLSSSTLVSGTDYIGYLRSARHLWAVSAAPITASSATSYDMSFSPVLVGDVNVLDPVFYPNDLDGHDNIIDTGDFFIASAHWFGFLDLVDFNNDDIIDTGDFFYLSRNWFKTGADFMNNY